MSGEGTDSAGSGYSKLKRANEALKAQLKDALASDRLISLNNRLSDQDRVIAALAEENKTLKNELRKARKDIELLTESNGALPSQMNDLTNEIRNSKEKCRKLQEKLDQKEKSTMGITKRMVDLESRNRKLVDQIKELENSIANNQNQNNSASNTDSKSKTADVQLPTVDKPRKAAIPVFRKKPEKNPEALAAELEESKIRERAVEDRLASALRDAERKPTKPKFTPAKVPLLPIQQAAQANAAPVKVEKPMKPKKPAAPQPAAASSTARVSKVTKSEIPKPAKSNKSMPNSPRTNGSEKQNAAATAAAIDNNSNDTESYNDEEFHPAETVESPKSRPKTKPQSPVEDEKTNNKSAAIDESFWSGIESESDKRAREERERVSQKPFFQSDEEENSRQPSRSKSGKSKNPIENKENSNSEWFESAESPRKNEIKTESAASPIKSNQNEKTEKEEADAYEDDFDE